MRNVVVLWLFIFVINLRAQEVDLIKESEKIKNIDVNVKNALQNFQNSKKTLLKEINPDNKKEVFKLLLTDMYCIRAFTKILSENKYDTLAKAIAIDQLSFFQSLATSSSDSNMMKEVGEKFKVAIADKNPRDLCRFKIEETNELREQFALDEKNKKLFSDIKNSRNKFHPRFIEVIESLEKQKDALTFGLSSDRLPLRPGDYEHNFIVYLNANLEMFERRPPAIMLAYQFYFNELPEETYKKYCEKDERYNVVPSKKLAQIYCYEDNLNRVSKKCNDKYCEFDIDLNDFFKTVKVEKETTTSKALLIASKDIKQEECKSFRLLSLVEPKSLLLSGSGTLLAYKNQENNQCKFELGILPVGTKLKIKKIISLLGRGMTEVIPLLIVQDERNNSYEIKEDVFKSLKNHGNDDALDKIYKINGKSNSMINPIDYNYEYCASEHDNKLDKEIYGFEIRFNNITKKDQSCGIVKFETELDLVMAYLKGRLNYSAQIAE